MGARPSGVALSQDRRGVIVEADLDVRAVDRDLSIEPAWTHQGRVLEELHELDDLLFGFLASGDVRELDLYGSIAPPPGPRRAVHTETPGQISPKPVALQACEFWAWAGGT